MSTSRLDRFALGALLLLAGCGFDSSPVDPTDYPAAGLYTPGSTIGAMEMPAEVKLGSRCVDLPAMAPGTAATNGTLTISYETQSQMRLYWPRNCTAAWIETANGEFVATVEVRCAIRSLALEYFQDRACLEKPGPMADIVTSATLKTHEVPHEVFWRGKDLNEKLVADGDYKLIIEVTETDKEPDEYHTTFMFKKGATPYDESKPVSEEGPLKSVNLSWKPMMAGGSAGAAAASGL